MDARLRLPLRRPGPRRSNQSWNWRQSLQQLQRLREQPPACWARFPTGRQGQGRAARTQSRPESGSCSALVANQRRARLCGRNHTPILCGEQQARGSACGTARNGAQPLPAPTARVPATPLRYFDCHDHYTSGFKTFQMKDNACYRSATINAFAQVAHRNVTEGRDRQTAPLRVDGPYRAQSWRSDGKNRFSTRSWRRVEVSCLPFVPHLWN